MVSRDHEHSTTAVTSGQTHTPGPWLWQHSGDGDGRYVVWTRQPHTGELATVNCEDINGEYPARANAQLVAAAPDLLAVCKAFIGSIGREGYSPDAGKPLTDQMRAAIRKAEGL